MKTPIWFSFVRGSHKSSVEGGRLSLQCNHIKSGLCYFSLRAGRRITYLPSSPKCLLYLFPNVCLKKNPTLGPGSKKGVTDSSAEIPFLHPSHLTRKNAVWTATLRPFRRLANGRLAITLNPIGILTAKLSLQMSNVIWKPLTHSPRPSPLFQFLVLFFIASTGIKKKKSYFIFFTYVSWEAGPTGL